MRIALSAAIIVIGLTAMPHPNIAQSPPAAISAQIDDSNFSHELLRGPAAPDDSARWLAGMRQWRAEQRAAFATKGIDLDASYHNPGLTWAASSYIQTTVLACDRYFYDPRKQRYTVDRYLDDLDKRYGGIDSVLIWPTYPNMGVDDRNQFDLVRDLPGGIPALRQAVADFHKRGVRVLLPLNPWDNGTRDPGIPQAEAVVKLASEIGADGIFGDTMSGMGPEFAQAAGPKAAPLALEPENGVDGDTLAYDVMGWGYWWNYGAVPGVDRSKWLVPRHMTHVCQRWAHDRSSELQYAWFNGDGYESWENIWGIWNGITPRDAETLRRIATLQRSFSDLLSSPDYEPHVPMLQPSVFATKFPGQTETLWAVINRSEKSLSGAQMTVPYAGQSFYDMWRGIPLTPKIVGDEATLSFALDPHGFGAVLGVRSSPRSKTLLALLAQMKKLAAIDLPKLSAEWKPVSQAMVPNAATRAADTPPPGMVRVPAIKDFNFEVSGVEIEQNDGVDVQYPWESAPTLHHKHLMAIPAFFIDKTPVTNSEFKQFLDSSHYKPADPHNFLRDWHGGDYPAEWGDKPVTWVSLEDARAYAHWAGKRLPAEWEWQYAAQGADGRAYPWGSKWDAAKVPPPDTSRHERPPTDVNAFPQGASPFGVLDMVGNIWQWTSEFDDVHTRAAIVRGGSYYQPQTSHWYFPQAYALNQHGKYLLMAPSLDRSASIGFRCAVDARD